MCTLKWYSDVLMLRLPREGRCHKKYILKDCKGVSVSRKGSLCSQLGVVPFGTGMNLRQVGRKKDHPASAGASEAGLLAWQTSPYQKYPGG